MQHKNKTILMLFLLCCLPGVAEVRIPSAILNYQSGPEYYLIVVEKSSQTLAVYSNYHPEPLETFTVTTGRIPGRKKAEGDMKTPEGVYIFQRILSGDELPKSDDYGEKAFTMNFPNPIDRLKGVGGSGIWLHGAFAPDKTDFPNNTRGCVVLHNDDLKKLAKYLYLNQTPIVIYDRISWETPGSLQRRRELFLEAITSWKTGWEQKNLDQYIGAYHPSFTSQSMNLAAFRQFKARLNKAYEFIKVFISNIRLFSHEDSYLAVFDQMYISDQNHFSSRKMQYWLKADDNLRIVAENTANLPGVNEVEVSAGNFVSIDHFRRNYLRSLREKTQILQPVRVVLNDLLVTPESIRLVVNLEPGRTGFKAIPVALFRADDRSIFRSIEGVDLNGGTPRDFNSGTALKSGDNNLIVQTDSQYQLRSITVFIIDGQNEVRQILTHIVAQ